MSTPTLAEKWEDYSDLVFATLGDALGIVQSPATGDPFVPLHLAAEYGRARMMASMLLDQVSIDLSRVPGYILTYYAREGMIHPLSPALRPACRMELARRGERS